MDTIPLVADDMRSSDLLFQKGIDHWAGYWYSTFRVPPEKILRPEAVSVDGRVQEICHCIEYVS
ncbi:hypothetical protein CI610_02118 [invertebrate metagenome]|uniref:Uncharacterized protein n=1 Tax=invertebrate metagenome TaxID=1711999 RepID=A0A2H9T6T0_9ZZZZ